MCAGEVHAENAPFPIDVTSYPNPSIVNFSIVYASELSDVEDNAKTHTEHSIRTTERQTITDMKFRSFLFSNMC